ncbi:unnamed protein product [Lactuca saligna]|uniref:lipid-A-disaccharide synthase n=1 Tax=Lactuca saligna TaxID=75948 RepID=A0AA36A550_LACSI|nr:unnamed protein product [Lactuca saligna]
MLLKPIRNSNRRTTSDFLSSLGKYFSTSRQSAVDLASKDGEMRIFLVAGEASGDAIGSRLIAALTKLSPFPIHIAGVGGSMMAKHGLKSVFPMEDIAVMGIWELLPHLNKFQVRLKQTFEAAISFNPHVIVTIDSKGFSFRLLKQLRARYGQKGPLHFHYVAPSFWAWKGGEARLKGLSEFIDHVLCILPFEEEVCISNGLPATFVGHPILEDSIDLNSVATEKGWKVQGNADMFRGKYGISSGSRILSLLPGSRLQEVTHHIKRTTNEWPTHVVLVPGGSPHTKYDAFSASSVALCTSGTAAMELQLVRLPCVIAYRAHFLTEWAIRYKAKIPYISLPNILLNSPVIPEALFRHCSPKKLACLLTEVMCNEGVREEQVVAAERVMELLRPPQGGNLGFDNTAKNNTTMKPMAFLCLSAILMASILIQETKAEAPACDPRDPNCVVNPSRKNPLVIEGSKEDKEAEREKEDDTPEIIIVGHRKMSR